MTELLPCQTQPITALAADLMNQIAELRKENKALRAASPSDPTGAQGGQEWQVPEGFVLIPLHPTIQMLNAGQEKLNTSSLHIFRAMIAAAPPNNHNREGK